MLFFGVTMKTDLVAALLVFASMAVQMSTVECAPACTRPLDIVFMLDESGSVGATNFESMKTFVNNIVGQLTVGPNGTHVAVISFDSLANVDFYLNQHPTTAAVQSAISNISYNGGGTNFNPPLLLARDEVFSTANGARPTGDATKVAILITDGQDSSTAAVGTAQDLRNAGIRVMAVGIGSGINFAQLLKIVLTPNNLFNASDFNQLGDALVNEIVTGSCDEKIDECASDPCENGATCNDGENAYTCNCADGYTGKHCETNIDKCESDPCQHGGSCVNGINSYTCVCLLAYTGTLCETPVRGCDKYPCFNGGTCDVTPKGKKLCRCPPGFTGPHCQHGNSIKNNNSGSSDDSGSNSSDGGSSDDSSSSNGGDSGSSEDDSGLQANGKGKSKKQKG